jgi:uncharacterized protein (DUF58 family)
MKPRYHFNLQLKYPPRHGISGDWAGAQKGVGFEFWGLRQYTAGDSFWHIDWKAKARTGDLYVKEFLKDSAYNLLLICDVSPSMRLGDKAGFMVDVASSLACAALQSNNPCGLLLYADGVCKHLPASPDPVQLCRVIAALQNASGTTTSRTNLLPALRFMKVRMPSCLGVILSDFNYAIEDLSACAEVASSSRVPSHELVAFHLLEKSEYAFDQLQEGVFLVHDVETGAEREMDLGQWRDYNRYLQRRREAAVQTLAKSGIDSLILKVGDMAVQNQVNTFFARRMSARI